MWPIETMTGYQPKTTFWSDFGIADRFGEAAVKDTYKRAFKCYKNDVEFLTELCMVLNWKLWEHSENNSELAKVYDELWKECDAYCMDNLKDDDLSYFLRTTD